MLTGYKGLVKQGKAVSEVYVIRATAKLKLPLGPINLWAGITAGTYTSTQKIMKNTILSLSILLTLSLFACTTNSSAEKDNEKSTEIESPINVLSKTEIADGWTLLFDGETTAGWRGFKMGNFPDKGWHVIDGTLMIEYSGTGEAGFAGDIITDEVYGNFDLKLEWKISPGGNSGILFYVNESDQYKATWHTANEIQVIDEFGYEEHHDYVMTIKQMSGAYYDLYSPLRAAAKVQGEWNEVRIKMENGHLQHWLNGILVIDTQLWTEEWEERVAKSKFKVYPDFGRAKEGHIGLQDHGQQVWYRSIKIKEL